MKISRDFALYVHYILDELVPPVIRGRGWFMKPLLKFVLKDKYVYFVDFKEKAFDLSEEEFKNYYENTYGILDRETDLNKKGIDFLVNNVGFNKVLEVGCGNGFLSGLLAEKRVGVVACDINITEETIRTHPSVKFVTGSVEKLPFDDYQFDEVVCTHTLEHVRNLPEAISELRRVTRKKLIIIVPRQKPNKYTFDLHLSFFPYEFSLKQQFLPDKKTKVTVDNLAGDWLYIEDYS